MPLTKLLCNQKNPDLDEPVFKHQRPHNFCPKCKDIQVRPKPEQRNYNYEKREYKCKCCGWEGTHHNAIKRRKPMDDDDARQVLRRCVDRAYVTEHLATTPKKFFRKSWTCYWSTRGRVEEGLLDIAETVVIQSHPIDDEDVFPEIVVEREVYDKDQDIWVTDSLECANVHAWGGRYLKINPENVKVVEYKDSCYYVIMRDGLSLYHIERIMVEKGEGPRDKPQRSRHRDCRTPR